ncbi:MAG: hypothetical protein QNJ05_09765 [Woeseiaceae bacterium]|nr:hypothetical protein [Woeseiaceae bacterium]
MRSIALILLSLLSVSVRAQEFHTSPNCWETTRIYASGKMTRVQVSVEKIDPTAAFEGTISPNGAYSFDITGRAKDSDPDWFPRLIIFNERPYLLEIRFPNTKTISKAEWINENLIAVRLWWGRVAGSDFIVDAEKEEIIYQQPIRWGDSAFQHFKQCNHEQWKGEAHCQCSLPRTESTPKSGTGN